MTTLNFPETTDGYFRKGDRVKILGKVRYFQDSGVWYGEFPRIIWIIEAVWETGIMLRAPGFGEIGDYGNGIIFLSPSSLGQLLKIGQEARL